MSIPFYIMPKSGTELSYVESVLKSGWVTSGKMVEMFEEKLRNYIGCKYALAVNSCTSALHLALKALNIQNGDKVLVPTLTFSATAEAVTYLNATPILMDIDPKSGLVTPDILVRYLDLQPDIKAIIIVHYGGQVANMKDSKEIGIVDICRERNIKIIEDCAHSFGSKLNMQHSGTFGDIGCFSFYANKCITTGEGGLVVTDSPEIANRVSRLRLHGMTSSTFERAGWEYDISELGYKYNMNDINAAVGIAQLEKADIFREKRKHVATLYSSLLSDDDNIQLLQLKENKGTHSWHLFPVLINSHLNIRDEVYNSMKEEDIHLSVHYKPLHKMTAYKKFLCHNECQFIGADDFYRKCISLPIYPDLEDSDVIHIANTLKSVVNSCIRKAMNNRSR